ncbi:MAG TPA: hypothetical protein VHU41_05875 [Thermoanaerobaculia bacterium]|jgi:hypothetical protein|nr:hypothetical protein [Thermoanaerobaculia bacterium]
MFRPLSLALLLLIAVPVLADDYYLIEMNVQGQTINGCSNFFWDADAIFYNLGTDDQVVTLAGVSNGEVPTYLPTSFHVAPGRTGSLRQAIGIPWEPAGSPPMWIIHVTASPALLVDSEMLLGLAVGGEVFQGVCRGPVLFLQQNGKTQLPVFRSLVAASQRQVIRGLSIGDVPGHINVAIYNGGANTASATIEVHRACDGAITETRNVVIDPNVAQQFTGFAVPETANACAPLDPSAGTGHLAYVVVTVDQPSLTFASILGSVTTTNNQPVSTIQVMPGVAQ